MTEIGSELARLQQAGLFRRLKRSDARLDFASNDYLGLSRSPEIRAALIGELSRGCALGSTGSRLLTGQTETHERVESFLARLFQAPSALLFSSGYLANLGILSAFAGLEAEIFSDEFNHASLIDGIALTRAKKNIFRHNDIADLQRLLGDAEAGLKLIVTESVFSQDGDFAPLSKLTDLAAKYQAWLIVDEAHATGVFGQNGLGRLQDLESSYDRIVSVHTGGKALGGQGAFVLSNLEFRELMINRSRSFVFSTGLAPLCARQIELALKRAVQLEGDRKRLLQITAQLRTRLFGRSDGSQILPVVLGSNEAVVEAQKKLAGKGFDIRAIRSPTVPKGTERLRVTLKSFHSDEDIAALGDALSGVLT